MQGLDFRKKRKNTLAGRRRKRRRSSKNSLRFDTEQNGLRFVKDRVYGRGGINAKGALLWAVEILIVCMTAVLLVAAFGQRVSVVGDSMSPALRNGDVVLVNHFIYNIKDPARGDIVVFRQNENSHYSVKRVVGLPGETVEITDGKILINGEELTEDIHVSDIVYAGTAANPVELGDDEYFVIGDNHTASDDSRTEAVGNVKKDDIYGEAWLIAGPWGHFGFI